MVLFGLTAVLLVSTVTKANIFYFLEFWVRMNGLRTVKFVLETGF
jgi:hypothetical protein